MLMKKQKQSTYSLLCQNMQTKVSLLRHSSKKKATCGYHTNHNSNRAIFHQNKFCAAAFDQSGLNNHATQNRNISLRSKISTSINNGRHFFLFGQNRHFDLPSLSDPFILSIISVVKINKQSTRGTTI